jgi:hypothetical protein
MVRLMAFLFQGKKRPTKRAPDAGDSGAIPSIFLRLSIFQVGRRSAARPSAGNANRWAAGHEHKSCFFLIAENRIMVSDSNNEDELEQAICLKSDIEFKITIREWQETPISKEHHSKIEENIKRSYQPFATFASAIDIRVEDYLLPLIKKLIHVESELRNANFAIYTEERITVIRDKLRNLAKENWEYVVYGAYGDAIEHVIHANGYLPEYKDTELRERRDELRKNDPVEIFRIIDELLQKASAESKIRKIQSKKESSQELISSRINIKGNVSGSTIIIGNDNETKNSQKKSDVQ